MLDIIVVNYNSTGYLVQSVYAIYQALRGLEARIFIEDNASGGDVGRVKRLFPHVHLRRNRQNLGFARAVNGAIGRGDAPYIVLVNPDCLLGEEFFPRTVVHMAAHPEVGILGPKIVNRDGSLQGSARAFPNFLTGLFGRTSLLTRWFPDNPVTRRNLLGDGGDEGGWREVDWVSGACMVVRRQAVEEVGLLDERFFLYWEDADWCRRMWESGWRVVYFPQAFVVHHVGGSSKSVRVRSLVEFHRSAYRLFAKYARGPERLLKPLALWVLALRLLILLCWNGLRDVIKTNLGVAGGGNGPHGRARHPERAG